DGMALGSHSVSHPETYEIFPGGDGRERYPAYQPGRTAGAGTLFGELRVSKHLLETALEQSIRSYRPGRIETLNALPHLAEAAGYQSISTLYAPDVLTHWPYRTTQNGLGMTQVDVFHYPIGWTDSAPNSRESFEVLTEVLGQYGGVLVAQFTNLNPGLVETQLTDWRGKFGGRAWVGSLDAFADWWRKRDQVELDVRAVAEGFEVALTTEQSIEGICVQIPAVWVLKTSQRSWTTPRSGRYCTDLGVGRQTALFSPQ
ncbi:MAG: hypothetical protein AAFO63_12360, partial [Pseudomonadota bacterium]